MRYLAYGCIAAVMLAGSSAAAQSPEDKAQSAAETWLQVVDDGAYDASWDQAAKLFKGSITKEQWKQALTGARTPLGKRVSRKVKTRKYAEKLPGAPDGKYVVIEFDTAFEHKSTAVETVTPLLDTDGAWRVSGYFIR